MGLNKYKQMLHFWHWIKNNPHKIIEILQSMTNYPNQVIPQNSSQVLFSFFCIVSNSFISFSYCESGFQSFPTAALYLRRSADIRCPVSDQSLLIKITNLPLQTQSNTISIVHWLKEYIYRIDSYNTFSLNHHKLGFDRMKGWSETGPLISADLRALRQSLALPFVLSGIVTFWI